MNILSAPQLKNADIKTIANQKICSWDLMERAGYALFEAVRKDFDIFLNHFTIICGAGNNGGDGLALARILHSAGSDVTVFLYETDMYSADNLQNQNLLQNFTISYFNLSSYLDLKNDSIIIDALIGNGINRPLSHDWAYIIGQINNANLTIISIDVPSGLNPDGTTEKEFPVIMASKCYTFHCPKITFLYPKNSAYIQDFEVLDIGLEDACETSNYYLDERAIRPFLKKVDKFSHKGSLGHACIIGGSYGKIGAPILSSKAALKTGCGLVSAYIPKCGNYSFQSSFHEAMVSTDKSEKYITEMPRLLDGFSGIGLGVGLGTHQETVQSLEEFFDLPELPNLVIDADAINILATNQRFLKKLPKNSILTPHPKELMRLIGKWKNDEDKIIKTKEFSRKYKIIILIKGVHTAMVFPDNTIFFNSTGNYGMATAGSGDVLTGIITSLLAQSYTPIDACKIGVYIHGLAADYAIKTIHPKSLIASDIIEHLSAAWKHLYAN